MKHTKLVMAIAITMVAFHADAQWLYNGIHIYNSNTGNVGINNTTPIEKLSVRGNNSSLINIASFLSANRTQGIGIGFNAFRAIGSNANVNMNFYTKGNGSFSFNGGNVGIGIAEPVWKLDVSGSLNLAFDSSLRSGGVKILTALYSAQNTFTGFGAGSNTASINNFTGGRNTFVGWDAGFTNVGGSYNSYFGSEAGLFAIGSRNTFIGHSAGEYSYKGSYNIAVGFGAGLINDSGSYNCLIGDSAGWGSTGSYNVYIGHLAGPPHYINLFNSAAIGSGASVTADNSMMFGNDAVNFWGFGITTPVAGQAFKVGSIPSNGNGAYLTNGGVWTDISDRKKKENITQLDKQDVLDKINILEVTKWKYKGTKNEYHIGPMADDFYKIFEVGTDSAISAMDKTGVLFLGMKALIEKNTGMQLQIKEQQQQIEELKEIVNKLSGSQAVSTNTGEVSSKTSITLTDVKLEQNIPNPFTNTTSIRYSVPVNSKNVRLNITDNSGKLIKQLTLKSRTGVVNIDASMFTSGNYYYTLFVDRKSIATKQMMILK